MSRQAVITGIGLTLPGNQTTDALWENQLNGNSQIKSVSDRLTGSRLNEADIAGELPGRLAKKLDVFTRFAMVATKRALADAQLDLNDTDKERTGVFVGNGFGGWQFTETELRNLHCDSPRAVSPFQATAWFPAAPQGQISIYYGIKGFSKTYMADRISSLLSISSAAQQIEQNKLDVAIAGGCEATACDFVTTVLEAALPDSYSRTDYQPFSKGKNGFASSEGAVFLILEDKEKAEARGAKIYAQVSDFVQRNAPCPSDQYTTDASALMQSMSGALGERHADVVLADACGLNSVDNAEAQAIREVTPNAEVLAPKATLGHSFGAEGALDVALACLMLQKQTTLPSQIHNPIDSLTTSNSAKNISTVLINGLGAGGAAASLVIEK